MITCYLSPLGAIACCDRSYGRRPSFPTTLLSSDITLMSTDITPMQVDITPLQGGTGSLAIDPTPPPTAVGLMSLGLTAARVDIARLSVDLTLPSIGSTPRSIVSDRLSPDITTPSFDRTMRKPVLTVFASVRWSSGGEPGCGPTAGGRPGAGKLCSLPFSSHKEVSMRFPRTEAGDRLALASRKSVKNKKKGDPHTRRWRAAQRTGYPEPGDLLPLFFFPSPPHGLIRPR